jgi:HSP20 family protein
MAITPQPRSAHAECARQKGCSSETGAQEGVMLTRDFLPAKRFEDYFGRMERLLGPERLYPFAWPRDLGMKVEWSPTADIIEMEKEYLVKAELPEVPKEDIHIEVNEGMLRLHGERKYEKKDKSEKMQRMERFYGEFERTFALPDDVDVAKITAESKDGVLKVHLPRIAKAVKAPPVQVRIQ